jgi:hypothetical protein
VKIAEGQVRSGTWEQLEEAVKAGHLDERMLVLAAGAHEWVTLGSVLNRHLSAPAPVVATAATPEEAEPVAAPQQASVIESEQEPEAPAQDAQGDSPSVWDEDRLWQVKLTGKQLEMAFHAGLLDKDALVQADGDDEPVRLGDIVRPQSVPPEPALAEESGHDGAATNGAAAQSEATGESLQE